MNWIILVLAGVFEVIWTIGLKYSDGFTRLWPSIGTAIAMIISVVLLGIAMKGIPVGTAYAVWTGIGTLGAVIFGIYLFNEPANLLRLFCLGLIVTGIIGLKLVS